MGADGGGDVHPLKQITSHEITKCIGVIGHDNARAVGVGFLGIALLYHRSDFYKVPTSLSIGTPRKEKSLSIAGEAFPL